MNKQRNKSNENINKNATIRGSFFAFSKRAVAVLLVLCLGISCTACGKSGEVKHSFSALYSFGEISLMSYNLSESKFESLQGEILDVANTFDGIVSLSNAESELSQLSEESDFAVSEILKDQIEKSLEYHEKTRGAFNILLAPVVSAWGFLPGEDNYLAGEIPSSETLESLRDLTDISKIKLITLENTTLQKPQECTIDLGGISKGYMADMMWEIAKKYNCNGILNVGGIVVCCGDKNGENFNVAITNPKDGGYFEVVEVANKTLVTSGNYERFFEVDGKRYCHIIDPKTLAPTDSDVVSVSILSESATDADIFATALMILDEADRIEVIKENNLDVLLIYGDNSCERFGDFPMGK